VATRWLESKLEAKVVVKTEEDRGVRDCFLKDASRSTCCAARRAKRKSIARAVERNDHRGAVRDSPGFEEKIAGVAKGWSGERNEYELILFHESTLLSFYCRPTLDRTVRDHPFRFSNPALFICQPSSTWERVGDITSCIRHSRRFARVSSPSLLLVILRYWRYFFRYWECWYRFTKITMKEGFLLRFHVKSYGRNMYVP